MIDGATIMCDLTKMEGRMDAVGERLARIETGQAHHAKQLDRVVVLLDRMVRLEEHVDQHGISCGVITERLVAVETELSTWKSVRKFFAWSTGFFGAFVAIYIAWKSGRI